jgi:hypothetical protein
VIRILYLSLLRLHPPSFRERFAEEMLWIFDEAATLGERTFLLGDGFRSVFRQWIVRSGMWKYAVALLVAVIQAIFFLHPY